MKKLKMIRPRSLAALLLAAVLLTGGLGCSYFESSTKDTQSQPKAPTTARHSFDDILVPTDLDFDASNSFVFESTELKAGTLYFSGYVDPDSLKNFFVESMPKDGWQLKSIFRFPKTVLLFEKSNKVSIIEIYEKTVLTHVEIWVAPVL